MYGTYATGGHPFWGLLPVVVYANFISHACQVRVTVGESDLCCCTCVYVFRALISSLVC